MHILLYSAASLEFTASHPLFIVIKRKLAIAMPLLHIQAIKQENAKPHQQSKHVKQGAAMLYP